jgi:hypothetical protein
MQRRAIRKGLRVKKFIVSGELYRITKKVKPIYEEGRLCGTA